MSEFARILAEVVPSLLGSVLEECGFRKQRGLGWRRGSTLEMRIVRDSKALDPYRGGAFLLEFEVSDTGRFMVGLAGRARLARLLDSGQKQRFLEEQNSLAERFEKPSDDYVQSAFRQYVGLIPQYMAVFLPAAEFNQEGWMRFQNRDHLREWCGLLVEVLPDLADRASTLDPHKIVLGQDLGW